jgi:hypothetical protein
MRLLSGEITIVAPGRRSAGRRKHSVFPAPVAAMPRVLFPASVRWMMVCWKGRSAGNPKRRKASASSAAGNAA